MLVATYIPALVVLSVVLATTVSYTALALVARVSAAPRRAACAWLIGGSAAMGCGIWSMHFVGMLAFRLPIDLRYDAGRTALSLLVAVLTSGFALTIASRAQLRLRRLLVSGVVMGSGICAMHYLGMAAILVTPAIQYDATIVAASAVIAVAASVAALWLAFALRAGASWRAVLARIAASILMGLAISGMHYTGMAAARFGLNSFCGSGVALDRGWSAAGLGAVSMILLSLTVLLAWLDSHLARRLHDQAVSLKHASAALDYQRSHDPVTGLPNRASFAARVSELIGAAADATAPIVVAVLNLDRFRLVNDTLGHDTGDLLLRAVGERMAAGLRHVDTVARGGGDEFLVALTGLSDPPSVEAAVRDLFAAFSMAFTVRATDLFLSPSIGIAVFPGDGTTADALIAQADEAMDAAKRQGGHQVRFYESGASRRSESRLDLENDLRRALAEGQFELHYQPKVEVASGRIRGAEALLRWRHPVRGWISPGDFIPIAEETGLIVPIGRWVLGEACRQARRWRSDGLPPLRVAVNASAVQLRASRFAEDVRRALEESDLEPDHLEIEVTESVVMTNAEASVRMLEELNTLGVHISIDDFGTGYSSMSYLSRLPIDTLKIDRSFVSELGGTPKARTIVQAIVMLGHALGLKTVAEGVETDAQRVALLELGCDHLQGFLLYAPMPAAAFADALRSRHAVRPESEDAFLRTYSRLRRFTRRVGVAAAPSS